MFGFGGSVKIYYCPTPVNMRKSFDSLAGAVEEYIKQDPFTLIFLSKLTNQERRKNNYDDLKVMQYLNQLYFR